MSYSNLRHLNQRLIIGSGQGIPIHGLDHIILPTSNHHKPLMRCDSVGDLYPVTSLTPFVGLANSVWHNHLGHPNSCILQYLRMNKFITSKPFELKNYLRFVSIWQTY